jgi:hypothetical protein
MRAAAVKSPERFESARHVHARRPERPPAQKRGRRRQPSIFRSATNARLTPVPLAAAMKWGLAQATTTSGDCDTRATRRAPSRTATPHAPRFPAAPAGGGPRRPRLSRIAPRRARSSAWICRLSNSTCSQSRSRRARNSSGTGWSSHWTTRSRRARKSSVTLSRTPIVASTLVIRFDLREPFS